MFGNSYYLVSLLIAVAVAYYLYTDAKKTGRNPVIWGLLGFFFSLISLVVYLVLKSSDKKIF